MSAAVGQNDHHEPVLLHEVLATLIRSEHIQEDGSIVPATFVDATFGRGGHSKALLNRLPASSKLIGLDRDPAALVAGHKLAQQDSRFSICQARFSDLQQVLAERNVNQVQGVLLDVGVSSPQLDEPARGFSFSAQGPLDMRMNPAEGISAAQWLNSAEESEITKVLWMYGEERRSKQIARAIIEGRPLSTTQDLANAVLKASPRSKGLQTRHPATRTFQAVRIFINEESTELDQGLRQGFDVLAVGGRLSVISFHSLEDRKVKHAFRQLSQPPKMPRRLPVRNLESAVAGRLIGGATKPSLAEVSANPRSRSATLRVIERVR